MKILIDNLKARGVTVVVTGHRGRFVVPLKMLFGNIDLSIHCPQPKDIKKAICNSSCGRTSLGNNEQRNGGKKEEENKRIVRGKRWVHNSLFITDYHRVGNLGGLFVSGAASVLVKSVVYAAGIVK